jgi:hypothetical protein
MLFKIEIKNWRRLKKIERIIKSLYSEIYIVLILFSDYFIFIFSLFNSFKKLIFFNNFYLIKFVKRCIN